MIKSIGAILVATVLSPQFGWGGLTPEQLTQLPPAASQTVRFVEDIQPILQEHCLHCHGRGKAKGGFSLETKSLLLKGGDSGPAVAAGNSAESYLIELVSGLDPDNVMPLKGNQLSPKQVGLLRGWIDQGIPWAEGVSFAKQPPRNFTPRQPELPPRQNESAHPIDRLLAPYFAQHRMAASSPVDDRRFARRVYFDVIGLPPSPAELETFQTDSRPDKRERLVQQLLNDRQRYAEHWLSFWNDALRNDYRGTGYIDGGRKQISSWLFAALFENMPYDQFVAELVNPSPASEGFVKGIVWRGAVNASQTPEMQAAQNISQLFVGVNLKCASCHDSFINDWTLADAYGLAAVYADGPLEMFRCDKPTGKQAVAKFIYPELGDIPVDAPKAAKQKRLAAILISKANGRLTRTIVNRLWQRFFGVGLVEPVDDMDQPAWHPDLLDWLAEDLAAHKYNLKRAIELILTSQAYQRPAVSLDEQKHQDYVFTGPAVRRLTAEQFRDALGALTGVWYDQPSASLNLGKVTSSEERAPASAQWIWSEANAAQKAPPGRVYFWKQFTLETTPEEALAVITCDNSFTLYANGAKVTSSQDFTRPRFVDLRAYLKPGRNVLAVAAINHQPNNQPPPENDPINAADANPAGLIFFAQIDQAGRSREIVSDATWRWSPQKPGGWATAEMTGGQAQPAFELGAADMAPWRLANQLASTLALARVHGGVRSSLVASDPLLTALGRPPREQMMTRRQSAATTLQALELTNGETFSRILQEGAKALAATPSDSHEDLIRRLYLKGLNRPPETAELELSRAWLDQSTRQQAFEDFLWTLAMLPEFQLIY